VRTPRPAARSRFAAVAAVLALRVRGMGAQTASPEEPPSVTAGPLAAAIRVDGILDEPAWQAAGVIADLTQQSPKPGEPTPFHTEVRILADGANVYFGITAIDPEPSRIAIHTM